MYHHQLIRWIQSRCSSWKRLKPGGGGGSENVDDGQSMSGGGLCSLPDEVLHIILGLVDIEEAVRTCVLSRRWQRLWMSMPDLKFFTKGWDVTRVRFFNFVDRVCALHEPFPIERFVLLCSVEHDAPRVNAWITSAVMSGRVQILKLMLYGKQKLYTLPHCLFRSETLVEFKLNLFEYTLQLEDTMMISLPRLKILEFVRVGLVNGETIQKLLSSSPLLETLSLTNCVWQKSDSETERLSSPSLRVLRIHDPPSLWIQCPSLEMLFYSGSLEQEVYICGPTTKLEEATIGLPDMPTSYNVFGLLHCVAHAKRLNLYGRSIEGLNTSHEHLSRFPQFSNLVELRLSFYHCRDRIMRLTMLRRCPCLERIALVGGMDGEPSHETLELDPVPPCFRTHIKKITLVRFWASVKDFDSVVMLLRNSAVLEEMILEIPKDMSQRQVKKVRQKVKTLPIPKGSGGGGGGGGSKGCTVSVVIRKFG